MALSMVLFIQGILVALSKGVVYIRYSGGPE